MPTAPIKFPEPQRPPVVRFLLNRLDSARMHALYLRAVLRHKLFVYQSGRAAGPDARVGRWQLLVHDLSKFSRTEWSPYAAAFYGPSSRTKTGKPVGDPAFDRAWLHHQQRNPHHWQFHLMICGPRTPCAGRLLGSAPDAGIMVEDSGRVFRLADGQPLPEGFELVALPMPDKFRREMVADWRGANKAYGDISLLDWYAKHRSAIRLHPITRAWVEHELGYVSPDGLPPVELPIRPEPPTVDPGPINI